MRRALLPLVAATIVASCDSLIGPPVERGPASADDRLIAQQLLEEDLAEHSLFLPPMLLEEVATAVHRMRPLDDVTSELLAPVPGHLEFYSTVAVAVMGDDPQSVARRELLAACPDPFQVSCWPALDAALGPVEPVTARRAYMSPTLAMLIVTVPPSVDRFALAVRLEDRLAPSYAWRDVLMNDARTARLVREPSIWRFVLKRGYGDCIAGCIFERYYEYLYDPVSGKAWMHREYGDPWPPPE